MSGRNDWEMISGGLDFKRANGLHYQDGYIYAATEGANVHQVITE